VPWLRRQMPGPLSRWSRRTFCPSMSSPWFVRHSRAP